MVAQHVRLEEEPDPLDRVQMREIGGQVDQLDASIELVEGLLSSLPPQLLQIGEGELTAAILPRAEHRMPEKLSRGRFSRVFCRADSGSLVADEHSAHSRKRVDRL